MENHLSPTKLLPESEWQVIANYGKVARYQTTCGNCGFKNEWNTTGLYFKTDYCKKCRRIMYMVFDEKG